MKFFKFTKALCLSLVALMGLLSLDALATNLLTNSGLNDPFDFIPGRIWNGQNEKIASGWTHFYINSGTHEADTGAKKLHWMSSGQFGAAFGGLDYHIEGNRAQNMWSSYKFDAGIYQQITGLTPGQGYGFDIAMVTFWRGPGYPDSDGLMVKQVGIDPTGGVDPTSSAIIWSEPNANDKAWIYMDTAATAQAATITVFAKVQAPENTSFNHTDLDMVYFDAAHMAPVPTTTLNASASGTTVNLNWSGSSPAPAWSFKGYEVQYRDLAGGNWITLQPKTSTGTSGAFTGQLGHSYAVRARTWQKINESYQSDIDMPGVWQEKTATLGALASGQVTTNRGTGLGGVTVTANPGGTTTTTDVFGNFNVSLANAGEYTFSVGAISNWTAPPPVTASVQLNNTTHLSFTLRPPDDVISNGDFENGLNNWQVSGPAPTSVTSGRRSGNFSLHLADTVALSQTGTITGSYETVLSFWYKLEGGDGDDVFSAHILGTNGLNPVNTFTTSSNSGWQQAWLALNLTEVYTGPIGVRFSLSQSGATQANVYLDEISLGGSWGGPNDSYLPVIFK